MAGCLVLDGTRNSADPEAGVLTAAAKQANRATIRNFIATEYPDRADELAAFVTIAMAGMSAAARDGADRKVLAGFAANVSRAFHHEVGLKSADASSSAVAGLPQQTTSSLIAAARHSKLER